MIFVNSSDLVNIFRNQVKPYQNLSKYHSQHKEKSGNESKQKSIPVARNVSEDGADDIFVSSVAKSSLLNGTAKQEKKDCEYEWDLFLCMSWQMASFLGTILMSKYFTAAITTDKYFWV